MSFQAMKFSMIIAECKEPVITEQKNPFEKTLYGLIPTVLHTGDGKVIE